MATVELLPNEVGRVVESSFPTEDSLYEIVDGLRVAIAPMSAYAGLVASRLVTELNISARPGRFGQAAVETLFRLPLHEDRSRNRRPDVAFVSDDRWPVGTPIPLRDNAWDVVPDLAVEVVSPHDLLEEVLDQVDEYFRAGVRLVWVVLPVHRRVYVYESPSKLHVRTDADALDAEGVLPGFRLPLAGLFDPPAA